MKTIKKLGEIKNGDKINVFGNSIKVSGIWNDTKVQLRDNEEDHTYYGYYLVGDVMNGTMYNAKLMQDTKHEIFKK